MKPRTTNGDVSRQSRELPTPLSFSPAEIKLLHREAAEALALRKRAGLGVESYQEKRLEFALELNRDEIFDTVKTRRYAKRIKAELAAKMREGKNDGSNSNEL